MIDPLDLFERMSDDAQIRIFERMIGSSSIPGERKLKRGSHRRDKLSDNKINEIIELRKLGNLSIAEIAQRTGVSTRSVTRYTAGTSSQAREISKEEAEKILNDVIPETI